MAGLHPLPDNWCPINDPFPEGWYGEVTILPEDYFNKQFEMFEE